MRYERRKTAGTVVRPVVAVVAAMLLLLSGRTAMSQDTPQLLIQYETEKGRSTDPAKLAGIFLRPNTKQTIHLLLSNPSEDRKQFNVSLSRRDAAGQPETMADAVVTLDGKETKLLPFIKSKNQVAAAPLLIEGPPFQLQITVQEVRKGKDLEPLVVPTTVKIRTPSEYVIEKGATYDVVKKRLTVRFRASDNFSGPPCPIKLILKKHVLPGLLAEPPDPPRNDLRGPKDEVAVAVDNVDFDGLPPKNGRVYVTVDGYERAFMYKSTFDQGNLEPLESALRVRMLAPRYANPKDKFVVQMEVDAELAKKAWLEVGLDRGNDVKEDFRTLLLSGPREQKINVAVDKGGLVLETSVRDWMVPLDSSGVDGKKRIRARLLGGDKQPDTNKLFKLADEQNQQQETIPLFQKNLEHSLALLSFENNTIYATTVFDAYPPQQVKITSAPEKHPRKQMLLVKAKGESKDIPIKSVVFFVGEPDKEGKPPKGAVPATKDPRSAEWSAKLDLSGEKNNSVDLYVCFTNAVGLTAMDKRAVRLFDGTNGPGIGRISGTVDHGGTKQPDLEVQLKDAKGAVVKRTKTDSGGVFVFENVAPGRYVVFAQKKFTVLKRAQKEVDVPDSGDPVKDVNLSLSGSG